MKRLFHRRILIIGSLVTLDGLFFGLTSPTKLPSVVLIFGFLLLALTIYHLFKAFLTLISLYGLPTPPRSKRLARLLSGLTAGLLALQSIGELSLRDVLVVLPLAALVYLYLSYGPRDALN